MYEERGKGRSSCCELPQLAGDGCIAVAEFAADQGVYWFGNLGSPELNRRMPAGKVVWMAKIEDVGHSGPKARAGHGEV